MLDDFDIEPEEIKLEDHRMVDVNDLEKLVLSQLEEQNNEENLYSNTTKEENSDYFDDFETSNAVLDAVANNELQNELNEDDYYDIAPMDKKFVVAVNPDNVPFFDQMEPEERSKLLNNLLTKYQKEEIIHAKQYKTQKMGKHVLVVALTVFIGLPLIFKFMTSSINATINSYKEAQTSFENLYQQKGGLKKKDLSKIRNLQY